MRDDSSYADALAREAGTTLAAVARRWPTPRYGLRPKQVRNRVAQIRRAVRHGGLNAEAAARLAALLNCSPNLFLYGFEFGGLGLAGLTPSSNHVRTQANNKRRSKSKSAV
jgi:hypothetical protein